ncbi:MAG: copper resistance D family protein [Sphingomonadales bacterium]
MIDILLTSGKFLYLSLLLLSAGWVLFYVIFKNMFEDSHRSLIKYTQRVCILALIFGSVFPFVDAVKFVGSVDGIFDFEIQKMIFQSHLGVFKTMAFFGLLALTISSFNQTRGGYVIGIIGVTIVAFSFSFTGHTAENLYRFILAPLLGVHLAIIIFWYGSLVPLYLILKLEKQNVSGKIIEQYSRMAFYLVPVIFVAGLTMGAILLKGLNFFESEYGLLLLLKIGLFSTLMLIAALNKWKLGPALLSNQINVSKNLQRVIMAEFLIISSIVLLTAILTGYFSPSGEY